VLCFLVVISWPACDLYDLSGTTTYSLDNKAVTWEAYESALAERNIFPKLKNFLIPQGSHIMIKRQRPRL